MKKKQAIRDLALRYRPREKAKKAGLQALNNSELLAIIISSGQKNCNALELAKKVERQLQALDETGQKVKLSQISGIGEVLSTKILASLELGKRLAVSHKPKQVATPSKIFELASDLGKKKQEYCLAFFLNGRQELIGKQILAIGGLNYNFMEARDIFEPAFAVGASSFILVHNHPSGDVTPSDDDLLLTEKIAKLADQMGIKMLDHLVIGHDNYFSIREHFSELFCV